MKSMTRSTRVRGSWRLAVAVLSAVTSMTLAVPSVAGASGTPGVPFTYECEPGTVRLTSGVGLVVGNWVAGETATRYLHPTCATEDPIPAEEIDALEAFLATYHNAIFPTPESREAVTDALQDAVAESNSGLPTAGTIHIKSSHPWNALGYKYWDLYSGSDRVVRNGTYKGGQILHLGANAVGDGAAGVAGSVGALAGCTAATGGDIQGWLNINSHLNSRWHGYSLATCIIGAGANQGIVGLGFGLGIDYTVGVNGTRVL